MTPAASASIDRRHAFPIRQMIVLGLCRICEPIAFMSIFPYIYYMIDSFHITHDGRQIALYAGLVTSAFAFAECLAGPFWGRLSDTMLLFGFARDLPTAIVARALGGLLNGNIGVLQTTVAEVVTVEAHQARAYAIMPFVWCIGSIVGAALGGRPPPTPSTTTPPPSPPGTLLDRYPYLLTNLVCAAVASSV
ncbi:Sugar transporter [Teratosphaeria destructans]|uniref:Sugar transporter n=1 Tax=Teratosphaeria destructans TaxID=418781 RepID=A0A9W7SP35_9PEZI|nr:Sugar transporter [Teratosphaeria destructans]